MEQVKSMKPAQDYRKGKKAYSVLLDEPLHWEFRRWLVERKTTFQEWATEKIHAELAATNPPQ